MRYLLILLLCLLCSTAHAQLSFERHDPGITAHLTAYKQTVDPDLWWMWGVKVADVDGDGKPDIYLAAHNYSSAFLYLQGDDLQFTHADTGWLPKDMPAQRSPAIADFTGNGHADIVPHEGTTAAMLQQSDGTFLPGGYRLPNRSISIEDINGDGFLDVRADVPEWGDLLVRQYINQMPDAPRFEFTETVEPIPDDIPEETRVLIQERKGNTTSNNRHAAPRYWRGDLNGSGREDMIVQYGGSYSGGGIRMGRYLFRDESGTLVDKTETCGIPAHLLPIYPPADTAGTGRLSILTGYGSLNEAGLYVQGDDDTFTLQRVGTTLATTKTMGRATYSTTAVYIHTVHWLDLDGDGDLDAVLERHRGGDLYIYENHDGVLLEHKRLNVWDAQGTCIADVNGNGKLDIIIGGRGEDSWLSDGRAQDTTCWIYLNTADYDPDPEPDPDDPDPEPEPLVTKLVIDGEEVVKAIEVLLNDEHVGGPGDVLKIIITSEPDPDPQTILVTPETIELVEQAQPGQEFLLAAGEYRPFTLKDRENNLIKADGLVHVHGNSALYGHTVTLENSHQITLDGLTVSGGSAAVGVYRSNSVTITRCTIQDAITRGILTSFADDFTIENSTIKDSGQTHGVYVSNSSQRPVVRNNKIRGNPQAGIHINGDRHAGGIGIVREALITGNVVTGNGIGINLDGATDSTIKNNTITDGVRLYGIDGAEPSSRNTINGNLFLVSPTKQQHTILIGDGAEDNIFTGNEIKPE